MYPISRNKQTSAYDRVSTMFSPDGRLYQVEYASKIVEQGTMGIGIAYDKGILFGVDKRVSSKLLLPDSIEKLFKVDDHIGVISAGLVGDARRIVQMARKEAQENRMYYDEKIQVETLAKRVASMKQLYTQYGGMRPFGVSFVIGGFDETGPRLFETEPSGALAEYYAVAIGKGKKDAMKLLEKDFREKLSFEESVLLCSDVLEKSLGEKQKLDIQTVEFAFIEKDTPFTIVERQKIKSLLSRKPS
ncbi:MAG: archaeal proteasome endopeptidase complex subunit alpha [Candidatus Diapherotrites archaeon]|nr:archaeal proteasome endopeptidase complex subunit alpha [Candidatus Diapherotrites archaeon]